MIGFWSGFVWLVGMTLVIALLSEYVVNTIEVTMLFDLLLPRRLRKLSEHRVNLAFA